MSNNSKTQKYSLACIFPVILAASFIWDSFNATILFAILALAGVLLLQKENKIGRCILLLASVILFLWGIGTVPYIQYSIQCCFWNGVSGITTFTAVSIAAAAVSLMGVIVLFCLKLLFNKPCLLEKPFRILSVLGYGCILITLFAATASNGYFFSSTLALQELLVLITVRTIAKELHPEKTVAKISLAAAIVLGVLLTFGMVQIADYNPYASSYASSSKKTRTCGYCNRTFSQGSDDYKSIGKRKLCENCYSNMTTMTDILN